MINHLPTTTTYHVHNLITSGGLYIWRAVHTTDYSLEGCRWFIKCYGVMYRGCSWKWVSRLGEKLTFSLGGTYEATGGTYKAHGCQELPAVRHPACTNSMHCVWFCMIRRTASSHGRHEKRTPHWDGGTTHCCNDRFWKRASRLHGALNLEQISFRAGEELVFGRLPNKLLMSMYGIP